MVEILILVSLIAVVITVSTGGIVIYYHSQKEDFDLTPRNRNGEELDEYYENDEDDASEAPEYEDDVTYDDWSNWEELLTEAGIIDIRDGMIEYETGNNQRLFVALAEMQQSNPYLKTDDELNQQNAIQEVFFNGINHPLKLSSQSQRVEMTDFLNRLKENSQRIIGSTPQMKQYAIQVIDDTLNYQHQTDRFENRAYLQFMALISPDEVYGDTPEVLEEQIHEKAAEKLVRQISRASGLLKRADHALAQLDTFGLLEVLYKTFNRTSSVKTRLEDIVKQQRYAIFSTAIQTDKYFKQIQQRINIETEAINKARDYLLAAQQKQNEQNLAAGKDYYQDSYEGDNMAPFEDLIDINLNNLKEKSLAENSSNEGKRSKQSVDIDEARDILSDFNIDKF